MKASPLVHLVVLCGLLAPARAEVVETDVLVFGATAGVVSAACTAVWLSATHMLLKDGQVLAWTDK